MCKMLPSLLALSANPSPDEIASRERIALALIASNERIAAAGLGAQNDRTHDTVEQLCNAVLDFLKESKPRLPDLADLEKLAGQIKTTGENLAAAAAATS